MPLDAILNWFKSSFRSGRFGIAGKIKPPSIFRDSFGNFEFAMPNKWKLDNEEIGFYDGKYTIAFHSGNGKKTFVVFVDTKISGSFILKEYATGEIEASSSGIYAKASPTRFLGKPAFSCNFSYFGVFGEKYFGRKIVFKNENIAFVLSCTSTGEVDAELDAMLQSFRPLANPSSSRKTIVVQ